MVLSPIITAIAILTYSSIESLAILFLRGYANEYPDKTITSGTLARSKQTRSSDDIVIQMLAPSVEPQAEITATYEVVCGHLPTLLA